MVMIFDANVHVGAEGINECAEGINKCGDIQDWGGKVLLSMVSEEGLTLVNNLRLV